MIVDKRQSLIDDVDDIIQIDEKQCLGAHALHGQIDSANEHVGAGVDANEIRDAGIQIQLRGEAIDLQENAIDAEVRNVEDDSVFRIFVRATSAASYGLRSRNCST